MRKNWLPVTVAVLAVLMLIGWHFYKASAFRSAIAPLADRDNMLFNDLITLTRTLPDVPLTTVSRRVKNNVAARNELLGKVQALNPYIYKASSGIYQRLLKLENDYARSLVDTKKALIAADQAKAGDGEMVEEEVETVRQVGKRSVVYRQKVFKRSLTKYKDIMERKRAAIARHKDIAQELADYETQNAARLARIVPPRNLGPQLENALRELK